MVHTLFTEASSFKQRLLVSEHLKRINGKRNYKFDTIITKINKTAYNTKIYKQ